MDDNGSIALCYARSSATAGDYASLGFTGRLASDPLGQMTFAETMVKMGTASQTGVNRFGDYSQTSMDPNGLTFWHTGEYLGAGPRTWIYSFQLPLPTGIEEGQAQINNVTAYQSIGGITVNATNLKEEGELVVDLFDITGKQIDGKQIVVSGNSFETSFSTSNLATGTYLVRVGKMNTSFQKVIKVAVK
ncbi:MAG: T9SS type A sorting domain-containing protein [Bacteroidetes bacterium]|nr:T9SS type A sorting domain-containing protein [Bacteroidota bacterium]